MATADYFLILVVAVCTYTDFKCRKIYNAVLFPAAAVGLVGNFYAGGPAGGLAALKGLTLGMALLFVPFIMGGMGAGDVKLLGVVGAFKGPDFVWAAFLYTALVGGLISIVVMIRSGGFGARVKAALFTLLSVLGLMPRVNLLDTIYTGSAQTFPYGIAIAAGTALAYFLG
ncbi:prepilin peptidase [Gelria sp. Kuro-4]|jgi:prepilin peptidase CpaA|uniref:A24 family peptidase n=1 Tax=Gelria sp. Kuro-4 TaxID=2796927 RepID=UPI001BEE4DB4|nr:A24 family peptidase [Gelria sp. Kuro-4]BCV23451.1 type 4 prepilin peptidase 1 [Gelria sp. Kuro-4]